MRKYILLAVAAFPVAALAQSGMGGGLGIGVKAGLNFANVTKASSINNSSRTGFHAGLFMAPPSKSIIGSRTELIFSRQGYNFKNGTTTGNVNLNYLILPQYMTIRITKFFQLQLGGQMAILLNAKADSNTSSTPGMPGGKIMDFYNRFDYGYGGGIEIHPAAGLLVGARINISLSDMYKQPEPGEQPSFIPSIDVKNNVFQAYLGWQFGKEKKEKKKKKSDNQ